MVHLGVGVGFRFCTWLMIKKAQKKLLNEKLLISHSSIFSQSWSSIRYKFFNPVFLFLDILDRLISCDWQVWSTTVSFSLSWSRIWNSISLGSCTVSLSLSLTFSRKLNSSLVAFKNLIAWVSLISHPTISWPFLSSIR